LWEQEQWLNKYLLMDEEAEPEKVTTEQVAEPTPRQ